MYMLPAFTRSAMALCTKDSVESHLAIRRSGRTPCSALIKLSGCLVEQGVHGKGDVKLLDVEGLNVRFQCG